MYKLPKLVIRYWLLVHSQKQNALAMNHELSTHNQSGFAPILLVILTLLGIAAGTLLIQTRTNFLPKAQTAIPESKIPSYTPVGKICINEDGSTANAFLCTSLFAGGWSCNKDLQGKGQGDCRVSANAKETQLLHCAYGTVSASEAGKGNSDNCYQPKCNGEDYPNLKLVDNQWLCYPPSVDDKQPEDQKCEYTEWHDEFGDCEKNGGYRCWNDWYQSPLSNCQPSTMGPNALDPKAKGAAHFHCYKDGNCPQSTRCSDQEVTDCHPFLCNKIQGKRECVSHTIQPAPAAQSAAGQPANQTTPVAQTPAAGTAPEVPTKQCSNPCPNSLGCFEIDGKPRCVFPTDKSVSCTEVEKAFCKNPPDPREDCEVAQATVVKDQTNTLIKFTRCTAAKAAGAPASAPAAAKAPNPALSSGAQSTNPASTTALNTTSDANIPCSDANQMINGIPCYKIGVFDEVTGPQIEKNAKIASENYKIYQDVLDKLGGEMDSAARTKAQNALNLAKGATTCIK